MHVQRTWEAIVNSPLSLDDVVLAEWIWAATNSVMSVIAILGVVLVLGFGHSWLAFWVLPLGFIVGLTFGAFGLVMNSLAPGYDFFTYFFTLVLTPMLLLSAFSFPSTRCPQRCKASRRRCRCRTRSTLRDRCSWAAFRTTFRCTSRCCLPMHSPLTTSRWC